MTSLVLNYYLIDLLEYLWLDSFYITLITFFHQFKLFLDLTLLIFKIRSHLIDTAFLIDIHYFKALINSHAYQFSDFYYFGQNQAHLKKIGGSFKHLHCFICFIFYP